MWVQRLLHQRGHTCMPLPHTAAVHTASYEMLSEIAQASAPYVTVDTSGGAAAHGKVTMTLAQSAVAVVWQQARLNYLLPALAPIACIACALHISAAGAPDGSDGYVGAAQISESAQWLRRLLAPDLDDALGTDAFTVKQHVAAELEMLASDGLLLRRPANGSSGSPTENARTPQGQGDRASDEYAIAACGKSALAFATAALAPLICTYAFVLEYVLEHAAAESMSCEALATSMLSALRAGCAGHASAVGPVPSKLLVQHALDAWVKAGTLQGVKDGGTSACIWHCCTTHLFCSDYCRSSRLVVCGDSAACRSSRCTTSVPVHTQSAPLATDHNTYRCIGSYAAHAIVQHDRV